MALTPDLLRLIDRMPKADLRARVEGSAERQPSASGFVSLSDIITENSPDNRRLSGRLPGPPSWTPPLASQARLTRADDFYEAGLCRLRAARQEGCLHLEIVFDPGAHLTRGAAVESALDGLHSAIERAALESGISAGVILSLSNYPKGARAGAGAALERCGPFLPRVLAIEIDASDPAALDPIPAELLRAMVRADGSAPRLIARAGSLGLCEHIAKALEIVGASRVERAARCLENPRLLQRLIQERVALTVSPLAEVEDGALERIELHPLAEMLDAGLVVAVGSDRPCHRGARVNDNLIALFDALALSREHARKLALNSFEASCLRGPAKALALQAVHDFFERDANGLIDEPPGAPPEPARYREPQRSEGSAR